jgi:hypothetical protein
MERGRSIAATPGAVAREGLRYVVTIKAVGEGPSLSFYVRAAVGGPRCTCPDYRRRAGERYSCEHIFAVVYFISNSKTPAAAAETRGANG